MKLFVMEVKSEDSVTPKLLIGDVYVWRKTMQQSKALRSYAVKSVFCFAGVQGLQPGGMPGGAPQHPLDAVDAFQCESRRLPTGAEVQVHLPGTAARPPAAPGGQEEGGDAILPCRRLGSLSDRL